MVLSTSFNGCCQQPDLQVREFSRIDIVVDAAIRSQAGGVRIRGSLYSFFGAGRLPTRFES